MLSAIIQSHTAVKPSPRIFTQMKVHRILTPHMLKDSHANMCLVRPRPNDIPSITIIRPKNGSEKDTNFSIWLPISATSFEFVNICMNGYANRNSASPFTSIIIIVKSIATRSVAFSFGILSSPNAFPIRVLVAARSPYPGMYTISSAVIAI